MSETSADALAASSHRPMGFPEFVIVIASIMALRRQESSALAAPILTSPLKLEKFATGGWVNAAITPDGKYFFYSDNKDVKWIDVAELDKVVWN